MITGFTYAKIPDQNGRSSFITGASSGISKDPQKARRLWDVSIELTGVEPGL